MHVKNTGSKVIGFGSILLLPGETTELPFGYDESHPTVQFYISEGFISAADGLSERSKTETQVITAPPKRENRSKEPSILE